MVDICQWPQVSDDVDEVARDDLFVLVEHPVEVDGDLIGRRLRKVHRD